MVKNKWQWILLALLMACAPFIYANVIGYWVLLITPVGQFFSVAAGVTPVGQFFSVAAGATVSGLTFQHSC